MDATAIIALTTQFLALCKEYGPGAVRLAMKLFAPNSDKPLTDAEWDELEALVKKTYKDYTGHDIVVPT